MAANTPEFEVDDAIVLLLGSHEPKAIRGITRLEKLIFLFQRETESGTDLTEDPEFEAYNFGPFSRKVYQAVDTLSAAGLIEDSARLSSSTDDSREEGELIGGGSALTPYSTRDFRLTAVGEEYYQALVRELPHRTRKSAARLRTRFEDWTLRGLVRYVYEKYPSYAENSLIRDQFLPPRE